MGIPKSPPAYNDIAVSVDVQKTSTAGEGGGKRSTSTAKETCADEDDDEDNRGSEGGSILLMIALRSYSLPPKRILRIRLK